jgi:hypothetical protein
MSLRIRTLRSPQGRDGLISWDRLPYMTKTIPYFSFVFVLRAQHKTFLFYIHHQTANQLDHLLIRCGSKCPITYLYRLHWFNVTVREKSTDSYAGACPAFVTQISVHAVTDFVFYPKCSDAI